MDTPPPAPLPPSISPSLYALNCSKRDAARVALQQLFGKVIATRRAAQAAGAPAPEDMLQAFIDAEYKDGA